MNNVANIIKELRETSSTNDKLSILRREKDNELLQKVLEYTLNPFKKYGLSEKSIAPININNTYDIDIFGLLDILSNSNTNDSLKSLANSFIGDASNEELQDLYKCMILKDLRINVGTKGINKVFKDLIPSFNVMLAESYFKQKEGYLKGREIIISTKLDGCRACIVKELDSIKIYSRQGQEILGLIEIENEVSKIKGDIIFDGELLIKNINNLPSDELFRETMKVVRKDGIKFDVEFHAFDVIGDTKAFKRGLYEVPCKNRKKVLKEIIEEFEFKYIVEVPILYQGTDESKVLELLGIAKSQGQEGVMINLSDTHYECKRSKGILKVKSFLDGDMKILDVIEGTGKNKGKLGAITVQFEHEDKLYTCDCGSGFKDTERELYYNNPELLIGKIATIGYFEISQNSKTKEYGLRFPTWKSIIRDDKIEISMN